MKKTLKQSSKALFALLFTVVITATALNASGQPSAFNLDTGTESKNADMSPYPTGDVNGDGKVDALDASLVLQYDAGLITFTEEQIIRADVNGDGKVDVLDASLILQYDAGLLRILPADIPQLAAETEEKLIYDYWAFLETKTPGLFALEEVRVNTYFGSYSGCEAVCMEPSLGLENNPAQYDTGRTADIAGKEFKLYSDLPLIIYKASIFAEIDVAYEMGWISDDDVNVIWWLYQGKRLSAVTEVFYFSCFIAFGYSTIDFPAQPISVCSAEELKEFYSLKKDCFDFEYDSWYKKFFQDGLGRKINDEIFFNNKYNEDFFNDKFLLFIPKQLGINYTINLKSIMFRNELVTITFKGLLSKISAAAEKHWFIVMELDKEFVGKEINLEVINILLGNYFGWYSQ